MLTNRAAIHEPINDAGEWLHIPPYGPMQILITPASIVDQRAVPLFDPTAAGFASAYNKQHGWDIDVSGIYIFDTPAEGMLWQDGLRDTLRDSNGNAFTVDFCQWFDDSGTIKRVFRNCQITSDPVFTYTEPATERIMQFAFSLKSFSPKTFSTALDTTRPDAGPYENIHYTTAATGDPPEGGVINITIISGLDRILSEFDGIIDEATGAGNVLFRQQSMILSATDDMVVKNAQFIGCDAEGGGTTTARIATTPYTSAGSGLDISLTAGQTVSPTVNTGSFTVTAGNRVYTRFTVAGNHSGPKIQFEVEPA